MAEIEKKFNLYGASYPNQSKSRPCLLSNLNENYNYFLLYLGFFRVHMSPGSIILKEKRLKADQNEVPYFIINTAEPVSATMSVTLFW